MRVRSACPTAVRSASLLPELSEKKRYIKRVTINGRELRKSYITYDDVMQGGEIRFTLTDQPGSVWYE